MFKLRSAFVIFMLSLAPHHGSHTLAPHHGSHTAQSMPPNPWDGPCVVVDSTWPFIHIVDCPIAPTPPQPSNPSPRSCQDCIGS